MHLLYTDEANVDPGNSEFFVYAGVAIPGENAAALSQAIETLRKKNGYEPGDFLKFNTRERPNHISPEQHLSAKQELVEVTANHGSRLIASFLLHNIAQSTGVDETRRNEINRVCFHFNAYLHRIQDHGLVLVDTFNDPKLNGLLREKFAVGITGHLPYSKALRLDRILGFHQAMIGTSHFSSVIDVVLGGLRYAVNSRQQNKPVCRTLVEQLAPLCIRSEPNGKASDLSVNFSPKAIRSGKYLKIYKELAAFLTENGIEPDVQPSEMF